VPAYRMVRLDRMREEGLTPDQMFDTLALAINDLGVMMAFRLIHGDRAADVYKAHGGLVRFDYDGHVLVPVALELTDEQAATRFMTCRFCGAQPGHRCTVAPRYDPGGPRHPAQRPHTVRVDDWLAREREDPAS